MKQRQLRQAIRGACPQTRAGIVEPLSAVAATRGTVPRSTQPSDSLETQAVPRVILIAGEGLPKTGGFCRAHGVSQKDRTKNISEIGRVGLVKNAEIPVSDLFEKHRTCPNRCRVCGFSVQIDATLQRFPSRMAGWLAGSSQRFMIS